MAPSSETLVENAERALVRSGSLATVAAIAPLFATLLLELTLIWSGQLPEISLIVRIVIGIAAVLFLIAGIALSRLLLRYGEASAERDFLKAQAIAQNTSQNSTVCLLADARDRDELADEDMPALLAGGSSSHMRVVVRAVNIIGAVGTIVLIAGVFVVPALAQR